MAGCFRLHADFGKTSLYFRIDRRQNASLLQTISPEKQIHGQSSFNAAICGRDPFGLRDSQHAEDKVAPVPPEGIAPYDPKPLMDALEQRTTEDKYRFVVLGDSKHASTFPALLQYMDTKINPDFVLSTGDMVQAGGGSIGAGYYEKFSMEAGDQLRKRPWWPAIANHELAGDPITGREATKEIKDSPKAQHNAVTGLAHFKQFYNLEKEYYSFTFRNAGFIALPFPNSSINMAWLEGELKEFSDVGKLIFVFDHTPFYTIGSKTREEVPNQENAITRLFDKYHVAAVFSGHDHSYYRTIRNGIPYVVSAGAGAQLYAGHRVNEAKPDDAYYTVQANTFGTGHENHAFCTYPAIPGVKSTF